MNPWTDTVAYVAVQQPSNSNDDKGGQGEDFGKSSPVGLVMLVLFFIAVFFLVRSMNKHLRKLPASFDEPADGGEASPESSSGARSPSPKKD